MRRAHRRPRVFGLDIPLWSAVYVRHVVADGLCFVRFLADPGKFLALRFVLGGFGDLQMHVENPCKKSTKLERNRSQIDAKSSK